MYLLIIFFKICQKDTSYFFRLYHISSIIVVHQMVHWRNYVFAWAGRPSRIFRMLPDNPEWSHTRYTLHHKSCTGSLVCKSFLWRSWTQHRSIGPVRPPRLYTWRIHLAFCRKDLDIVDHSKPLVDGSPEKYKLMQMH